MAGAEPGQCEQGVRCLAASLGSTLARGWDSTLRGEMPLFKKVSNKIIFIKSFTEFYYCQYSVEEWQLVRPSLATRHARVVASIKWHLETMARSVHLMMFHKFL